MRLSLVHKELVSIAAGLVALGVVATAFAAEVVTIVQHDRKFQTDEISIPVGYAIHFTNEDPFDHQLYADSPNFSFSSEAQPKGKILTVPFPVAGTFEVRCQIHPRMLLTVTVK